MFALSETALTLLFAFLIVAVPALLISWLVSFSKYRKESLRRRIGITFLIFPFTFILVWAFLLLFG
jgi:hypothetical protein